MNQSRQIKFRMWTGAKMLFDVSNVYECLKQQKAFDEGYKMGQQVGVIPYDHVGDGSLFLRFTGLEDKNVKEIYEGDIVRFNYKYGGERIDSVRFGSGAFHIGCIVALHETQTTDNRMMGDSLEVIGNIYQNPDLLK